MIHAHQVPRRRVLHVAAAAASLALPLRAQSDFPRGVLRIIVALPAGGASDMSARALGVVLQNNLKQPVVVENRPGGNFQIALQALQAAPADGHTLLHIYNGFPTVHAVLKLFDLEKLVTPITLVGTTPVVLLVKGDSPHKTLRDLVTFARANPGKVTYSTTGSGGVEHLKMAQMERIAGFKGVAVPYRGGADALKAVLGGEIDVTMKAAISAKQFVPSGQARVLAVMDAGRWKDMPDVPTFSEAGVAVPPMTYWGGYVVRSGTPPELVQRLYKELTVAAFEPSLVERVAGAGIISSTSKSPEEFRQFLSSEIAWMTEAAKGLDLKS